MKRYGHVWVRHDENPGQSVGKFLICDRSMKLEIDKGELRLFSEDGEIVLTEVTGVALKAVGSRLNAWVRVCRGTNVWFFANGALFGWGGIFGGTKRLAKDVAAAFGLEVEFD